MRTVERKGLTGREKSSQAKRANFRAEDTTVPRCRYSDLPGLHPHPRHFSTTILNNRRHLPSHSLSLTRSSPLPIICPPSPLQLPPADPVTAIITSLAAIPSLTLPLLRHHPSITKA
ncbi:hypothetical protein E2C01_039978 [Portunus trituberculatus]|uniref:Uncharacterized protein n=1 Tax=Portunus trituberculatus TaxID=210409 RepID=A0A5B7FPG9_PORTR|nr:hypothetical protein [Portunus trituberculatus]